MCGIVGTVGNFPSNERRNALDSLSHRGPDGEGEWLSQNKTVWLGHKRLAIIDPEGGKQPFSNEDGSIWIIFNGCIYNYLELAQSLRQKGHKFKTHSDTEVIIHAYEEWGEECLQRFIGMFAFAIWDANKQILFCARDRLGVKPFYFRQKHNAFVFASEIKAILAANALRPEISGDGLGEYLYFQTALDEKTLFKDIYRLLPGYFMVVDNSGNIVSKKQYWDIKFNIDYYHTEEYFVDHLRLLLNDAVKIRLRSDVSLGAHLSGGLDSSAVVCLAADIKDNNDPLVTFSGGFSEGKAFDETEFASLVSGKAGTTHHIIRPSARDFQDCIRRIIYYMDEPAAGPGVFPQYMVSKMASEHVKVVLGGQGGDEIFAGYARYLIGYLEECLKGAIKETTETSHYAATLATIIPNLPLLKQYTPMLKYFWSDGLFESQEDRYFRLMDRSTGVRDLYSRDVFAASANVKEKFHNIFYGSDAASFLNRMLYFDLKVHLPALLHVEDRTSMAWGLESRVPLLDHRIIEFITGIPPVIKFKGGQPKYLFKKAIRNIVPDEILDRKDKMGFPVPLHLWFKNELKDFVKEVLLDDAAKRRGIFNTAVLEDAITQEKDFGRVIWGALCLELWLKEFID